MNPSYDEPFGKAVARLAEESTAAPELERALRRQYPKARVVAGVTASSAERWYAYREGRWVNPIRDPDGN